jgi:hypothetical protein
LYNRNFRQEALLAVISEKDANIARLEEVNKTDEIQYLYEERDNLHQRLKELVGFYFLFRQKGSG